MRIFKSKLFIVAMCILIACSAMMIYSYKTKTPSPITNAVGALVTPLQKGLSKVTSGIGSFFGYFYKYNALKAENEELKSELAEYRALQNTYNAAVSENKHLRKLTGLLERRSDLTCELANITSVIENGFESGFSIDRGSIAGIEVGDPVITENGLVGYISQVGLTFSRVETSINMGFTSGAMISRTRQAVVAAGDFELAGSGLLRLSYIANDADVRVGDMVETSGEGGIYPKGIIIGRVESFEIESHGISSYATVKPYVSFEDITAVFVVKDFEIVE